MLRDFITFPDIYSGPLKAHEYVEGSQSCEDGYRESSLHILRRLITDPQNTCYFEVSSDEMELFGIKQGNLLVVDRSKNPEGGMIVIARQNGEWLVRQLITHVKKNYLTTGKEEDELLKIDDSSGIVIWGVVTWSCCAQLELK